MSGGECKHWEENQNLKAEVAQYKIYNEAIAKQKDEAEAEVERLKAELAEARKDTERLDVLIKHRWHVIDRCVGYVTSDMRYAVCESNAVGVFIACDASPRAAIDAARKKSV